MRPIRWIRRGMMLVGLGAAGGALFVTARHLLQTPQPLRSALPGTGRIDRKHGGDIYYNVAGDETADPIVLLHDFYPGASNYEYRHIFPRLAPTWRVYAPDWLGFGMSERPPLAYTGEFYANTLIGFLRDVVGRPAVVLGHGHAANIAARAAADAPDLFSRLVLISPNIQAGIELDPKPTQLLARAAQRTSLGLVPYAFLSTKPLLRRLAHGRSGQTGEVSAGEDTVEHLYASAHQFGGQHALLALMTGELDLPIQHIFPLLQPPVLLMSGDEDPERPVGMMEDLAVLNPHADLDVLSSSGEAIFEDQPAMFAEALQDWLATALARQQPQVEERHPTLGAEAAPVATPEPGAPESPVATEVAEAAHLDIATEIAESAEIADTTDTAQASVSMDIADTSDTSDTDVTPDTLEEVRDLSDKSASKPVRRSSSTPATRARGTSMKASASAPSEAGTPATSRPQRATRKASQSSAPSRPKSGTTPAKSAGSRSTGSTKSSPSAQTDKATTRKKPKVSENPD